MTNTQRSTMNNINNNKKRITPHQHHHQRSLSTPPTVFYDAMAFLTGVPQQKGMVKVRRAHTMATTTPTPVIPGRRASLLVSFSCTQPTNDSKGQALPQPLRTVDLLQEPTVGVEEREEMGSEEEEECGFLLTREQSVWGVDAVCAEICRRDLRTGSNSCVNIQNSSSISTQVLTIFQKLFNSWSVSHHPCRNNSLSSNSLPWYHPIFDQQPSLPTSYTVSVTKTSQQSNAAVATPTHLQPRHRPSSPSLRQDSLPRSCNPSPATKVPHTREATTLMLTSEDTAAILASLSMQVLLDLLALIVSKGPESFIPSYSDDFALFVQPHGKSYQDLINLLPKLSRELMTNIIVATRHWVRYEEVDMVGRRRRHSIESCSRDDLSLSGFGDLTSQEMPLLLDPNRACLQNLANALFGTGNSATQIGVYMSRSRGEVRKKSMTDCRIQRSAEESLQSIGSKKVEIGEKDAMEALENLMLLHACVDQLESWKKFSDEHAALPLPPWRTNVANVEGSNLVRQEKKAVLVRKSSCKYPVSRTSRPKVGRVGAPLQPHDLSALIPPVPSRNSSLGLPALGRSTLTELGLSTDGQYNYKTSYWQFKHRQDRARQDNAPGPCPPRRANPMVTGVVPHLPATHHLSTENEPISLLNETCLSATPSSHSLSDSSDSCAHSHSPQRNTPAISAQLAQPEFVVPPMKDLYSAPIIMDPSHLPSQPRSPAIVDGTTPSATSRKYVTATIDTNAIKVAAKRRPPPFTLAAPSSPTALSKSTATTSLSPTTAESFISKISSQPIVDQEVEVCQTQTTKKGWLIWEKPLLKWKRKPVSVVPNTVSPSPPDTSLPPVPSMVDRADFNLASPRTSSPIAIITAAVTSKQSSSATAAAETFPGAAKPWMRTGFGSKSQKPSENGPLKSPRPNLNIIIHQSTIGGPTSLLSSMSSSSQDSSLKTVPSPCLGCSIESIPFPEDYLSTVLSPSSSTSALWSAPPLIPIPSLSNGSSPRIDTFPIVTSISPLPSPSYSRKKRLQDKLFWKKSKPALEDACSSTYPHSVSTLPPQNRMTLLHGGVAGVLGVIDGGTGGDGPELRSSNSFGSLREKKSFGQLIVPLVLAPLEQRGLLGSRSRSSSTASTTAVGAVATASPSRSLEPGTPPPPSSPFAYPSHHCYEPLSDHDHHSHQRPPFARAISQPISVAPSPLLSSSSSSSFPNSALQPKPIMHMPGEHRYHNKVTVGSVLGANGGGGGGQHEGVGGSSGLGRVISGTNRDEKETNAQIWKVLDQWGAWREAHPPSK